MEYPRIVLAAPRSGSGKTLITCALIQALLERGKNVRAFKCGPDFIDPMFHKRVLGIHSDNLDLFFTSEDATRAIFTNENTADVSVIEGVMGLYDGLGGVSETASTYHLAKTLDAPIVLVVDAHGMGHSVLAEIKGFVSMDNHNQIVGVILNRTSKPLFDSLSKMIETQCGIKAYGYFPKTEGLMLESRHLGLKLPDEISDLKDKIDKAAAIMEESVDVDLLISDINAWSLEKKICARTKYASTHKQKDRVRIGVAADEAFCFYYSENLKLLERAGAELVFFSPVHDAKLPEDIDGILLGGGYPELVAGELSANKSMLQDVKNAICNGMPSLAECGGFMYLHEVVKTETGQEYSMVGAVPGTSFYTGKLVRFGYADFECDKLRVKLKGHEFHYFDSTCNGDAMSATKPVGKKSWECCHVGENHVWGYPHFYYASQPKFVDWFIGRCRRYQSGKFK